MATVKLIPKLVFTINFMYLLGFKFTEAVADSKGLARGFGNHIDWLTLEEGLKSSKNNNKPMMLLIHKSWCSACKALKPEFAASKEIEHLSKHFIMVNVEDNEEPSDKVYSPDGAYIPRILFLDPDGTVQTKFFNDGGNPHYKYFYSDAESITTTMKKVARAFKETTKVTDEL